MGQPPPCRRPDACPYCGAGGDGGGTGWARIGGGAPIASKPNHQAGSITRNPKTPGVRLHKSSERCFQFPTPCAPEPNALSPPYPSDAAQGASSASPLLGRRRSSSWYGRIRTKRRGAGNIPTDRTPGMKAFPPGHGMCTGCLRGISKREGSVQVDIPMGVFCTAWRVRRDRAWEVLEAHAVYDPITMITCISFCRPRVRCSWKAARNQGTAWSLTLVLGCEASIPPAIPALLTPPAPAFA